MIIITGSATMSDDQRELFGYSGRQTVDMPRCIIARFRRGAAMAGAMLSAKRVGAQHPQAPGSVHNLRQDNTVRN